jgi:site-specific DNA-methyltransferase (adenine-specific)
VPFAGSGSDCVAAQELGINFIGFETDPEFVRISNDRVSNSNADARLELDKCSEV